MSEIVVARELSKWFGEVVAINNLNLTISTGVTGLLGPNGAGKSTFIKLALGLYHCSRGSIRVLGEPPRNNLGVLRQIGYCPEVDQFFDNMTGFEFVYWMNRYWGMRRKTARVSAEEALDRVHMTSRMHDPIDEYSKGMRQRIKIAQALSTRPTLLFLDEPMNGLDPQGREEMFALIRELGDEGYAVVVSSHILYEVERVTENVVLLYNGSILAQGRVREIRDLIDDHPHTITIESSDPRAISRYFYDDPATMSTEFCESSVTIRTRDPNRCYQRINDVVLDEGVSIHSIRCADDNLQSVFEYLIK